MAMLNPSALWIGTGLVFAMLLIGHRKAEHYPMPRKG
jgi:hypothetical protein